MPLYDYKCQQCGHVAEVRHGFNESYGEPCAACGGSMARVFNPAPIVFKGSGFYVTDSRGKKPAKSESAESKPAEGKPAESKAAESKPAETAPAKTETKASEPAA